MEKGKVCKIRKYLFSVLRNFLKHEKVKVGYKEIIIISCTYRIFGNGESWSSKNSKIFIFRT